jgi:hypothetical protein
MNIRNFALCTTIAAAISMIPSVAQAVMMQTVYTGNVSHNSFDEPGFFGQGVRIDGLPFELSLIWDRDAPSHIGQSGVLDGSGPGNINYITRPFNITLKVGTASRTFKQITANDGLSEFRENSGDNFFTQTQFTSGNDGNGNEFSCALGVVLLGNYQPLFLAERYQISNATPLDQGGGCGMLQAMIGLQFGLDATSLTVAPLVTPIPVPPAIPMLLTGITALFGVRRHWRDPVPGVDRLGQMIGDGDGDDRCHSVSACPGRKRIARTSTVRCKCDVHVLVWNESRHSLSFLEKLKVKRGVTQWHAVVGTHAAGQPSCRRLKSLP